LECLFFFVNQAGHENIARLRKEMEAYMQKKETLENDLAGIRQKEDSFRKEFTLEMEVAHSEIDFLREKAKTHQKLGDIGEKRDTLEVCIFSIIDMSCCLCLGEDMISPPSFKSMIAKTKTGRNCINS
jgi:hypothetical protein